MQLSDILIERIDCFFNFHEDDENEMSHLEKTIYNHQNVAIRDSHEDAENRRAHIIHEDIALSAFERRERAQSVLITLTRWFKSSARMTVANKSLDELMHTRSSVRLIYQLMTFEAIRMFFDDAIVSELNDTKSQTIESRYVFLVSKI
jgi:hypothetical protein